LDQFLLDEFLCAGLKQFFLASVASHSSTSCSLMNNFDYNPAFFRLEKLNIKRQIPIQS